MGNKKLSDYEIMKIIKENGEEPTEKNIRKYRMKIEAGIDMHNPEFQQRVQESIIKEKQTFSHWFCIGLFSSHPFAVSKGLDDLPDSGAAKRGIAVGITVRIIGLIILLIILIIIYVTLK